jgi:hypothetical protein
MKAIAASNPPEAAAEANQKSAAGEISQRRGFMQNFSFWKYRTSEEKKSRQVLEQTFLAPVFFRVVTFRGHTKSSARTLPWKGSTSVCFPS